MKISWTPPFLLAAYMLSACSSLGLQSELRAEAHMLPTQGSSARGEVAFKEVAEGVRVEARFDGLAPGGHGFHVHEKGDCSSPDATSAGGHFNPTSQPHGYPDRGAHHVGDMPMLIADSSGHAELTFIARGMSLADGAPANLVGKAVIVHAAQDDFTTQPTGNSGGRIACGVIRR